MADMRAWLSLLWYPFLALLPALFVLALGGSLWYPRRGRLLGDVILWVTGILTLLALVPALVVWFFVLTFKDY